MAAKKRKKPKAESNPPPKKQPRQAAGAPQPKRDKPSWCVQHLDEGNLFGLHALETREDAMAILRKLKSFETMTWDEILGSQQNHYVQPDRISDDARRDLEKRKLDDSAADSLVSLRLSGRKRLWGFVKGDTFHILWWDPEHKVCPSHKRHT